MIKTSSYAKLVEHYSKIKNITLNDLFVENSQRAKQFTLDYKGLQYDFSKNNITSDTLKLLIDLAHESYLTDKITAMFRGDKINITENRAVLHTALRANSSMNHEINDVLERMKIFSYNLHSGKHVGYTGKAITDIVNIGIGGSDLGPVLVCQALKPYRQANLNIHFISSVDGYQIFDTLSDLNPETTLFIIASKTFTTQETITNANTAREWFLNLTHNNRSAIKKHFVAVSTNANAVNEFGIDTNNMFGFWDFVGGRYSLWSAIGLSIILYIGFDNFQQLLTGARDMDQHFINTTDLSQNLPVVLAMVGIWNTNFNNYSSLVISPFNTRLGRLPAYIQQLEMESNGKSVDLNGESLSYKTGPVIWGDSGINGQHAYYQLLHQGTSIIPMDIIVALSDKYSNKTHQNILMANAIAQAEAFMRGKTLKQVRDELVASGLDDVSIAKLAPHKEFKGNRPTNMLTLPELSPYYLGMLIALYEHKTFVQGVVWNINSFDQWGVELGKQLAKTVLSDIENNNISQHDSSTTELILQYKGK